ncbi:GNAT family N-acetyltransferase [Deinococcus maricopensis]|uniref:GCN5-related N-acetyltransferase n=1 Tax=Deinococcus maricopensis (strain DSM 21211 / LMG 22137 / NRRL B-23946 / LB-34) TaxID=709986 RepID=E8U5M4_DEIML|nr:GNAT family N-acetyltransferase [Deinococcus maricopensis]ADV66363.1 GCN5-related N-acetyltransferase [Deinococcus maricopensis DSM 21211]
MPYATVRPAAPTDAHTLALLHNSTTEPHFHTTAARQHTRLSKPNHTPTLVLEQHGRLLGAMTLWLNPDHPAHLWIGPMLHPDERTTATATHLLTAARHHARTHGAAHLWLSLREDYLPTAPDPLTHGFHEVHRTFGGGFHLTTPPLNPDRFSVPGISIQPALPHRDDPRLAALYALTRHDKVTADPTIPPASDTLHTPDQLWAQAFIATHGEDLIGLAVPERSGLGAWNALLTVHPHHRHRGLGTALQAHVNAALHHAGTPFLNTAGVTTDAAYLRVLTRLGARIEPDWIAYRAPVDA